MKNMPLTAGVTDTVCECSQGAVNKKLWQTKTTRLCNNTYTKTIETTNEPATHGSEQSENQGGQDHTRTYGTKNTHNKT